MIFPLHYTVGYRFHQPNLSIIDLHLSLNGSTVVLELLIGVPGNCSGLHLPGRGDGIGTPEESLKNKFNTSQRVDFR